MDVSQEFGVQPTPEAWDTLQKLYQYTINEYCHPEFRSGMEEVIVGNEYQPWEAFLSQILSFSELSDIRGEINSEAIWYMISKHKELYIQFGELLTTHPWPCTYEIRPGQESNFTPEMYNYHLQKLNRVCNDYETPLYEREIKLRKMQYMHKFISSVDEYKRYIRA